MKNINDVEKQALNELRHNSRLAWKSGDLDGFMDCFTDDVIWMPPDQAAITGKAACRTWAKTRNSDLFSANDEDFYHDFIVDYDEGVISGNSGYERIVIKMIFPADESGNMPTFRLKGMQILQKQYAGSWKISRYIWNPYPVE